MAEEVKKEKKAGKGKFLIIIILALVLLGGGVFAGVYYMKTHAATGPVEIEEAYFDLKEEFLVNLNDESGKRYVKAKIVVAYNSKDKDFGKSLETEKVVLRDGIIAYLKGRKAADVSDPTNYDNMKKELTTFLNKKLKKGQLTNVLFQDMVVQ